VRLVKRHAERVREVGAVELVAHGELDDLALAGVQPVQRSPHNLTQFRLLQGGAEVRGFIRHLDGLVQWDGRIRAAQPTPALVAGDRVQPRPEPVRIPQARKFARRDDERVLDHVSGVRRLAEQRAAVRVESRSVMIVGSREPGRLARHDRRHHIPVPHAITVAVFRPESTLNSGVCTP
jgi:hypothetical protein